jgi:hypothetical protein
MRARTANTYHGRRLYTQVAVVVALFLPIAIFGTGFITDSFANFVCLDVIFLAWFLFSSVELVVVHLREGTRPVNFALLAISLLVVFVAWLIVAVLVRSMMVEIYRYHPDLTDKTKVAYGMPTVEYGYFAPLFMFDEEARKQRSNPKIDTWDWVEGSDLAEMWFSGSTSS